MNSCACILKATGPFLMFLDVLESREHACHSKKTFNKKYSKLKKLQPIQHLSVTFFAGGRPIYNGVLK